MIRHALAYALLSLVALGQCGPSARAATAARPVPSIRTMVAKASLAAPLPAEPAAISFVGGADSSSDMLYAIGEGAVPSPKEQPNRAKAYLQAKAYAKMSAIAGLVQQAKGTMVDCCADGQGFSADARIKQEIKGVLDCVQVVSARKRAEGNDMIVEVTVRAPRPQQPKPTPACKRRLPFWAGEDGGISKCSAGDGYTSLIIDAQGLRVSKSMSPKIVRPDGSEVWGTVKVDPEFLSDYGIAAYARSRGEALANRRAGENPLLIRALSCGSSKSKCSVVISDPDADRIIAEDRRSRFLEDYSVVIIVGG